MSIKATVRASALLNRVLSFSYAPCQETPQPSLSVAPHYDEISLLLLRLDKHQRELVWLENARKP
jgi:hypothetical protein